MVFILTALVSEKTPSIITAGLNADWKLYFKDYLYSDSWVLTIWLLGNGTQYSITGTDNGDSFHRFTKLASETASYIAGDYSYTVVAVNGTSKVPLESGVITIKPNFLIATSGLETRSNTKIILDLMDKAIKDLASKTTSEVTIDGTSYKRSEINNLIKARNHYATLYAQEQRAVRMANGFADPNKKFVRFTRP